MLFRSMRRLMDGTGGLCNLHLHDYQVEQLYSQGRDPGWLQGVFRMELEEQREQLGPDWEGLKTHQG